MSAIREGAVYGLWTVLDVLAGVDIERPGGTWARVRCRCGTRLLLRANYLLRPGAHSCGCFKPRARPPTPEAVQLGKAMHRLNRALRRVRTSAHVPPLAGVELAAAIRSIRIL